MQAAAPTGVAGKPRTRRIGSRGSALALVQAEIVRDALVAAGMDVAIEVIRTEGDARPPDTAWGEGAFVSAIEQRLRAGAIDIAVHSAKDLPTAEDAGLTIGAFLPRASAADVLVLPAGSGPIRSVEEVPTGARVGTDSPRRAAFLRRLRPDLRFHPLHGNVDTRLRRLDGGETDVLVLAEAGLTRLGRGDRVSLRLEPDHVPPAPGQGALAVQVRVDDEVTRRIVEALDDGPTRRAVEAERALLHATGGGCRAPVGALGRTTSKGFELVAGYARPDASIASIVRLTKVDGGSERDADGDDESLVRDVLDELATHAAAAALASDAPRVVVTRAIEQAPALMLALVDRGLAPIRVPSIAIEAGDRLDLDAAVQRLATFDWVVVTSANTVRAMRAAAKSGGTSLALAAPADLTRWAAVGRATQDALRGAGVTAAFVSPRASGTALAETLPIEPGMRVLVPQSDLADGAVVERLVERGAAVESFVAYRTTEAPLAAIPLLREALSQRPVAVILTSGSTARGLTRLAELIGRGESVSALPAICIGPETATAASAAGFRDVRTSTARPRVAAIADAVAGAVLGPARAAGVAPDPAGAAPEPVRDHAPNPALRTEATTEVNA